MGKGEKRLIRRDHRQRRGGIAERAQFRDLRRVYGRHVWILDLTHPFQREARHNDDNIVTRREIGVQHASNAAVDVSLPLDRDRSANCAPTIAPAEVPMINEASPRSISRSISPAIRPDCQVLPTGPPAPSTSARERRSPPFLFRSS